MTRVDVPSGPAATRARRWLTRALLVVGGALAGTAAAWVLGTGSASANTDASGDPELASSASEVRAGADIVAVTTDHTGPRHGSLRSADLLTTRATNHVRDALGAIDIPLTRTANQVLNSVETVVRHIGQAPLALSPVLAPQPALFGLLNPVSPQLLTKPAPTLPEPVSKRMTDAVASAVSIAAAVPDEQTGHVVSARASSPAHTTLLHRASRNDVHTARTASFPFLPASPANVPPMHNGSATAGHIDIPLSAVPVSVPAVPVTDEMHRARTGDQDLHADPGAQPGVTPD